MSLSDGSAWEQENPRPSNPPRCPGCDTDYTFGAVPCTCPDRPNTPKPALPSHDAFSRMRDAAQINVASQTGGVKADGDKPRFDLIAPSLLWAVATILTFGARKYAARNWEKGIQMGRVFGACMRHLWAWWRGEDVDAETGESHLWHAACCIMFLIEFERRVKNGTLSADLDDRPHKTLGIAANLG